MLQQIQQTLRSLVRGPPETDSTVSRKRPHSSVEDDDLTSTPRKRQRADFTEEHPKEHLKLNRFTTWLVTKKRSFSEKWNPTNRTSPGRVVDRIASIFRGNPVGNPAIDMSRLQNKTNKSEANPAPSQGDMPTSSLPPSTAHSTPKKDHRLPPQYEFDAQFSYMPPGGHMHHPHDGQFKVPMGRPSMGMPRPPVRPGYSSTPVGRFHGLPPHHHTRGQHRPPPPPQGAAFRSMYEKTFHQRTPHEARASTSHGKLAARESIRLAEKDMYAELLQQYTSTNLGSSRSLSSLVQSPSFSRLHSTSSQPESPSDQTLLGTSVAPLEKLRTGTSGDPSMLGRSYDFVVEPSQRRSSDSVVRPPEGVVDSSARADITAQSPANLTDSILQTERPESRRDLTPHLPPRADFTPQSFVSVQSRRGQRTPAVQNSTPSGQRVQDIDAPQITKVEPPILGVRSPTSEKLERQLKECKYAGEDWIKDLTNKFHSDVRRRERITNEEETKIQYFKEQRNEWEDVLEKRIRQKLRLSSREQAYLEEDFEDEEEEEEAEEDEFPELSDEIEAQVDDALRPHPGSQVLSEGFRLQIQRKDMETLAGLNWLNDEVINFYMELIRERGEAEGMPKVHAFNTFFYPKVMSQGHSAVKRWTRRKDIFAVDYILIPVHLGMHWCLAVINFKKKAIQYLDSMGGKNQQCLLALKQYLEQESLDKKKEEYDMSDWTLEMVKGIPNQMNGSDCGVFTCKYADYITRERKITFTQENMPYFRRRMVYEILNKKLL